MGSACSHLGHSMQKGPGSSGRVCTKLTGAGGGEEEQVVKRD